jgi:peptidylprolyl isomerase
VQAPVKTEFALRYQDIVVGAGPEAQPGQLYKVHYTGWLESDGTKFDSSVDRGEPFEFSQGMHQVIPGWDQGFEGMHIGGKRRLFIPYELAYGASGRGPIPPKANLIFDVELLDARDLQSPTGPSAQPASPPQPNSPAQPPTPPQPPQPR